MSVHDKPYGAGRPTRVVVMGAGISGISILKSFEDRLKDVSVVCYEKNADIGGTWLENRYDGCACDIPSVNYQYSWKPALWSKFYSEAPEIWQYLKNIEQEYDLGNKFIKLQHIIQAAEWNDESAVWNLKIKNLVTGEIFSDQAEIFINGGGVLNNWKWPSIPGLHDFGGKLMHSAAWDPSYDFTGKRVAVIGAGSSGVQIVASIIPKVEQLYTWVRNPVWITAGYAQQFAGDDGQNFSYSDNQKKLLTENPDLYLSYRKQIEHELNQRFPIILRGSQWATEARTYSNDEMTVKLGKNKRLCEKVIPQNFGVGCRRPTPGNGFLEALVHKKTTCFTETIGSVTKRGFKDSDGVEHEVDAVICATGFDTSWIPRFPIIVNGIDLRDTWTKEGVTSYLSIAVPRIPNYFTFCGPYGPLAHGSFFPIIEKYTDYTVKVIEKMQVDWIRSIRPKASATDEFMKFAARYLKSTVWSDPCSSWFKGGNANGTPTLYPGSRVSFMRLLQHPRFEDFDLEYVNSNMWDFLGNGFSIEEMDDSIDDTYYLGNLKAPTSRDDLVRMLKGRVESPA